MAWYNASQPSNPHSWSLKPVKDTYESSEYDPSATNFNEQEAYRVNLER
jgi:hypothetical protein